ncbi:MULTISPECIES: hypothetical protein [Bradyrhizobium]|jgi:hypothetical protein|uniref:hypothetical protein n=1 Tax=Bradyrhizobium TaxID=374 RepID=UPI000409CE4F|nr:MULTISPECIES: hypothetical protein [Bradyrhizobium]KIU51790.1 hypothetical protein QU41_04445 [Bradyrhizobium elkanii]MBK5656463.1 hypothetical protein [Rhizobium sp.]OCX28472.1 hypothetical protein QU42_25855 [Bradyrhizobium sp. UASWS1016]
MEKVFLSYTFRPHPDHEANLERLRRHVIRAIEAMGLRVVDGVEVGGRPLDNALRKRIEEADALIALVTPQADDTNALIEPAYVLSEFLYAEGQAKPTMRVWHYKLPMHGGIGRDNEYTPYNPDTPGKDVDVILKLLATIALWKREYGQVARVRIEPDEITAQYDEAQGDRCDFQVISLDGGFRDFQRASFLPEPGAAYAVLPKLRVGDRVRLRLRQGNKTWQSRHAIDPFVGGVRLEEQRA